MASRRALGGVCCRGGAGWLPMAGPVVARCGGNAPSAGVGPAAIATINDQGLVTAVGKGDTHVVAFYDNGIAPVQVMLPVSTQTGSHYPAVPTPTRIDQLVVAKLQPLGIVPSELCTDAEFLRRA